MNYRQIAVTEYLDGFGNLESVDQNITTRNMRYKLDNWKTLSPDIVQEVNNRGGSILCRVRLMRADDYLQILGDNLSEQQKTRMINYLQEKEILDLPTYNQYFYINNGVEEVEATTGDTGEEVVVTSAQAQQATQTSRTGY
jgi:hypothetical protein